MCGAPIGEEGGGLGGGHLGLGHASVGLALLGGKGLAVDGVVEASVLILGGHAQAQGLVNGEQEDGRHEGRPADGHDDCVDLHAELSAAVLEVGVVHAVSVADTGGTKRHFFQSQRDSCPHCGWQRNRR